MTPANSVKTDQCDNRHNRVWIAYWTGFSFLMVIFLSLAAYGFGAIQQSAINKSDIIRNKEVQREIREEVTETRKMVYDLWRKDNGHKSP